MRASSALCSPIILGMLFGTSVQFHSVLPCVNCTTAEWMTNQVLCLAAPREVVNIGTSSSGQVRLQHIWWCSEPLDAAAWPSAHRSDHAACHDQASASQSHALQRAGGAGACSAFLFRFSLLVEHYTHRYLHCFQDTKYRTTARIFRWPSLGACKGFKGVPIRLVLKAQTSTSDRADI